MTDDLVEVETAPMDDADFAERTAQGQRLLEVRDLAFGFADTATLNLVRDQCTEVASGGHLWLDTAQVREPRCTDTVRLAARYLVMRGIAERNAAFPHLVRVLVDPATNPTAAAELPR